MADLTLTALRDEIEADPQGIGYKEAGGAWKGDQVIADLLNDPANGATIQRSQIPAVDVAQQITGQDYLSLTDPQRAYLALILPQGAMVDTRDNVTEVRASLLALFGAQTDTRANLVALVETQGSRAEVLWGEGTMVTAGDVGRASNLGA